MFIHQFVIHVTQIKRLLTYLLTYKTHMIPTKHHICITTDVEHWLYKLTCIVSLFPFYTV